MNTEQLVDIPENKRIQLDELNKKILQTIQEMGEPRMVWVSPKHEKFDKEEYLVDVYEAYLEAEQQVLNNHTRTDRPVETMMKMIRGMSTLRLLADMVEDITGEE